jgi:hypothetical protein
MIQVYVALALAGVGAYISNNASKEESNSIPTINPEKATDVYNNTAVFKSAFRKSEQAQRDQYKKSLDPANTGVISNNFNKIPQDGIDKVIGNKPPGMVSTLSGQSIEKFGHNNMAPYFSGTKVHNTINLERPPTIGGAPYYQKREVESGKFRDLKPDAGNTFGTSNFTDFERQHYVAGRNQNGIKPFQPEYVGPGLGRKDDPTTGYGGFQQDYNRELYQYKTVDELRSKINQKTTYDQPVIEGKSNVTLPGYDIGEMCMKRPKTYYENTQDRWFTTTAENQTAQRIYPKIIKKHTERHIQEENYTGAAQDTTQGVYIPQNKPTIHKEVQRSFGYRNADVQNHGLGADYDHGRGNILVYSNERDLTTCRTHTTNFTTIVKALTAPFTDIARRNKKEWANQDSRPFGMFQPQMPEKQTIYDPNDVARTTVKETLIHDTTLNNLTGFVKPQAATQDTAKTTMRETLDDQYHPNYQTLEAKTYVYDPNDTARTTRKETVIDNDRYGNYENSQQQGGTGYLTAQEAATPKYAHKHTISKDSEYYGNNENRHNKGTGYLTAQEVADPRYTHKHTVSTSKKSEHYGNGDAKDPNPMSRDNIANTSLRVVKEQISKGRAPTKSGAKLNRGSDTVNMSLRKDCDQGTTRRTHNRTQVYETGAAGPQVNLTRCRNDLEEQDNYTLAIAPKQILCNNPLAISLAP